MTTGGLILVAVLGVALLLFLVIGLRLQAFVSLIIASFFVALAGGIPLPEIISTIQTGMGNTLGFIAIVVGLGTMFGEMLRVTGGAEQLARTLVGKFGDDRAQWALGLTGFLVAIPVFFDVGLIILIPLIYSLAERTRKSLLYYAIPLTAGLAIAHSYIPPTPGPVAVASLIGADLGWVILFGAMAGLPAMIIGGIFFGKFIGGKIHLSVPDYMKVESLVAEPELATVGGREATLHDRGEPTSGGKEPREPLPGVVAAAEPVPATVPASEPPSFGLVISIIAVPLVLILLNTVSGVLLAEGSFARDLLAFVGHPFFALLLAALLSFYFLGTRRGMSSSEVQRIATRSLEPVGLIILVTGAGGVFGRVLVTSGVGEALAGVMANTNLPVILLAFLIATAVRVTQGSATVAMVTTAGLMGPILEAAPISAPALGLVTIAIASGATVLSHVNDSGFWLVSRYLGMSEANTLKSWTVMETLIGLVGFIVVFIISFFV